MRNKPRIRFKGFAEDWEQRKLSEVVTINPKTELPDKFKYVDLESVVGTNLLGFQVIKKENAPSRAQRLASYGDVFYQTVRPYQRNNYLFENIDKDMVFSTGYAQLRSKLDSYFLLTLVQNDNFVKVVLDNCTGTSYPAINGSELGKITVQIPSNDEEANQIGKVFRGIDNIITLHQRKLEKLKLAKKALLQKLFPKNGSQFPEIRFKGFTDAWEQRKLGDFYTFKNGLNKEKVYFGYGDSIVNFTDVFHNRQIYSSTLKGKVFVNKKELENFRVKEGDLFFTRTSETIDEIGFPAVVMEPMERVVFSGFVLRGRAEKNDPLVNIFKSYIFFTDNFRSEMKKKSSMTTRALTSGTALKEMYFSYPKDLEEQTKIGEILLRLDNIITLHQRKLDKLQEVKKGLLQKMFV